MSDHVFTQKIGVLTWNIMIMGDRYINRKYIASTSKNPELDYPYFQFEDLWLAVCCIQEDSILIVYANKRETSKTCTTNNKNL